MRSLIPIISILQKHIIIKIIFKKVLQEDATKLIIVHE